MHRLVFVDGDAPPPEIVDRWIEVVAQAFGGKGKGGEKKGGGESHGAGPVLEGVQRRAIRVAAAARPEGASGPVSAWPGPVTTAWIVLRDDRF